jgi:hypothetical protein
VKTPRAAKALTLALGAATLGLAASTAYLAKEVKAVRAGNAAGIAEPIPVPADPAVRPSLDDTPALSSAPAPLPATPDVPASATAPDEARAAILRSQLDEFSDPQRRAARVADLRRALEPVVSQMAQPAGLAAHEAEQLLDFMAESTVRNQQRAAQCRLTPGCDLRAMQRVEAGAELREMERVVGSDVVQRIEAAEARQRISAFGAALPADQQLPESAVTALATALAEEWRREVNAPQVGMDSSGRLQARAAAVLTAEQLALFRPRIAAMLARD